MATTQLDIKGVFDKDTGQLTGFASPSSPEIPLSSLVSGDVIVNSRDGLGRATSYTQGGVTYTVTYGNFGPATVSGGGTVTTYNYSATGQLTSVTTA